MKLSQAANEALASVVVFLVALPLCMGIAIASGLPPAAGLLSGIVGGLVVGAIAGSPLQVSGPAAGLVVLVVDIIQTHGLAQFGVIVLVAGGLQVLAGRFRLGRWFRAVAPEVLQAMLAGIGVLIVSSQLHVMIDDAPAASGISNMLALPSAFAKAWSPALGAAHRMAAGIGVLTLTLMLVWNLVRDRLPKALGILPAPLIAVAGATATATLLDLPILRVSVPESLSAMVQLPSMTAFSSLAQTTVLGSALALAFVASAQALLSASAVDELHDGPRSDLDRELTAQGLGNMVVGLLGGLPLTGVIVRSSANVAAGAKTRWSAILHALWLIGAVALFPSVLELIPVSTLAAVLVYVGVKLINHKVMAKIWARGRVETFIYGSTLVAIVGFGLLQGLVLGFMVSVLHLAWQVTHVQVRVTELDDGAVQVALNGAATFLSLPTLTHALDTIPPTVEVRLCLEHVKYVDASVVALIATWEKERENLGGSLSFQWEELAERTTAPRKRAEMTVTDVAGDDAAPAM